MNKYTELEEILVPAREKLVKSNKLYTKIEFSVSEIDLILETIKKANSYDRISKCLAKILREQERNV